MFEEKLKRLGEVLEELDFSIESGVYGIIIKDTIKDNAYVSDQKTITSEKLINLDTSGVIIYDNN